MEQASGSEDVLNQKSNFIEQKSQNHAMREFPKNHERPFSRHVYPFFFSLQRKMSTFARIDESVKDYINYKVAARYT